MRHLVAMTTKAVWLAVVVLAAVLAPTATPSTAAPGDECTIAAPPLAATVEARMKNAVDLCELLSMALAGDVFHGRLLVTPGKLWHYEGAQVSCRLHFGQSEDAQLSVRNSPETCRWLRRHAAGWHLYPSIEGSTPP